MVWVHGGSFRQGNGYKFDGKSLVTFGQVLFVSINYRLTMIGYMSTNSSASPGNYGVWDAIGALQWVNDNIAYFGGDASRITLFGQSAGGASVSHVALSPDAKGLFQRVIPMSGSAAAYFGVSYHQPWTTYEVARSFSCNMTSDNEVVECLRQKEAIELVRRGELFPPFNSYIGTQVPVIDYDVIPLKPIYSMQNGYNNDFDLLTGHTHDDGAYFVLPFTNNVSTLVTAIEFTFSAFENKDEIVEMIFEKFPEALSEDLETRQKAAVTGATDFLFGCQAMMEAQLHAMSVAKFYFVVYLKVFWG